jgi:lauroyl/myristoyl acyltransferase/phosphatidylglycerophosphate synthase
VRIGITPDAVTVAGTVGSVAAALVFLPRGQLFFGTLGVTVFVLFDLVDGAVARAKGKGTPFGAVLDSTCDRIADGALFAALTWWALGIGQARVLGVAALICLVAGQLISYIKARAEGAGLRVVGGLVERAERLILAWSAPGSRASGCRTRWTGAMGARGRRRCGRGPTAGRGAPQRRDLRPSPPRNEPHGTCSTPRVALVRLLPERVAQAAFRLGADLAVRRNGPGVRQLRANLARPRRRAPRARGHAQLRPLLVRDVPTARRGRRAHVAATTVTNPAPFHEALDTGRGLIVALSTQRELGCGGRLADRDAAPPRADPVFTTVGQRLRPESVYRRFVAHRVALGFDMVEEGAYRALLRRLRGGGVVCVLADRDVLGASLDVTLLGEPARLPSGPARLAALTGATLLPDPARVLARGLDDRVRRARPVPDVEKATQALGDALMELVADGPRPVGTSCSRCGRPIGGEPPDRDGLPVLARRAGRRPGARARAWRRRCGPAATSWRCWRPAEGPVP